MDKNAIFQGFLGFFLALSNYHTNYILLFHMLKIKGEIFELQVLEQFATTKNLMCKLQMIL